VHQGAGDGDALLLAAGERIDRTLRAGAQPARLRSRAARPRTPLSSSTRRTFSATSSVGIRLKNW